MDAYRATHPLLSTKAKEELRDVALDIGPLANRLKRTMNSHNVSHVVGVEEAYEKLVEAYAQLDELTK